LKKIGNLEEQKKHIDYNFFSYILATSDVFAEIMKNAFSCKENQIIICGHPRNDFLFNPIEKYINDSRQTVLWLPTHRNDEGKKGSKLKNVDSIPLFTNHDNMRQLNDYLKKLNIQLIIKIHPSQNFDYSVYKTYENIDIWTEDQFRKKSFNLYELLGSADALITDYSSVYFDYLLLDRPIAFTLDDMELYSGERGFVFDNPEKYMPGKKIKNKEQFLSFLIDVTEGKDNYKKDREKVNNIANYYTDGRNCERILKIVGIS